MIRMMIQVFKQLLINAFNARCFNTKQNKTFEFFLDVQFKLNQSLQGKKQNVFRKC